ncbi:MAG: DNA/RNA non-specific endonuclease [Flavobacteriales bacterium]
MKIIHLSIVLGLLFSATYCQQSKAPDQEDWTAKRSNPTSHETPEVGAVEADRIPGDTTSRIQGLEIPKLLGSYPVIRHEGYQLQYSEKHEQAVWVAYHLTEEETVKKFNRTDNFIPDPKVSTGSAMASDYANSGYDRGHLAPAADMGWSERAMSESFYYSNMSPQEPGFNRGIWKKLEEQVRAWAVTYTSVYIVTGPLLTDGLVKIGGNGVSVPKYYYKVILDYRGEDSKAIGFLMPNAYSASDLASFAVPIDQVEKETGIDFFPKLPDGLEDKVEKEVCVSCWSWKPMKIQTSTTSQGGGNVNSTAVQCHGITKAGAQCKRKTTDSDGFCYQHKP